MMRADNKQRSRRSIQGGRPWASFAGVVSSAGRRVAAGAVHVKNGDIVAVGKDVKGGGQRIDGSGMIVMPGLIDTHWHMWNTLFRSFAGDKPEEGYFPTVARLGAQMTPDDVFASTRLAAAEAINSGMTHVHSWCHNVRSTAHAEADIRALAETGIRA